LQALETVKTKTINRPETTGPAPAARTLRNPAPSQRVQCRSSLQVSSRTDPSEKEAEATAKAVMRMAAPESAWANAHRGAGGLLRQAADEEKEAPVGGEGIQTAFVSPYIARFAGVVDGRSSLWRRTEPEEKKEESAGQQVQRAFRGQGALWRQGADEEREDAQTAALVSPYIARFTAFHDTPRIRRQSDEEDKEEVRRATVGEEKEEEVRRATEGEEKEDLQRATEGDEKEEEPLGGDGDVQRAAAVPVARRATGRSNVEPGVADEISASSASGSPLPSSVRRFMEPRFRADFGRVRIHTDDRAARLSRRLSAYAFTTGNHIFFAQGRYQPESYEGRELIAHELTHTIQQGASVQRCAAPPVTTRVTPHIQCWGISDALDYFADKAYLIPGFRMLTIILGSNPINMRSVDRSAANILRAIVEFIPGGALITQALDNYGVFERVGTWVEGQIARLGMTGAAFKRALDRFLDSLSWSDIFHLGDVWERAKRIFTVPIAQIISFVRGLARGIIRFIKDAILRPLARLAEGTRGYNLLKALLGQDPVTGDPYPRNAETLIGGFMELIGRQDVWENLQQSRAIPRAWAWFQRAIARLMGFIRQIPSLFARAFAALEIEDIVLLPRAFAKVAGVFGGFVVRFVTWAGQAVWKLLEIIFDVVAPGLLPYLRTAAGTFRTILADPVSFVMNLVRAGRLGFMQFARNFGEHLKAGLIGWLTGSLAGTGVYIPQSFTLREMIKFVLSALGLTWQNIRRKLVRVLGETVVGALETRDSISS